MHTLAMNAALFTLPSRGKAYTFELLADGAVKIRPFLAGDQKVLASRATDPYQTYYALIDRILVEPRKDVDIGSLLVSDTNATLFAARIMSFGTGYPMPYRCEQCGSNEKHEVDLAEIDVKYEDDIEDGFSADGLLHTLANGDIIEYHLPRLNDEKAVSRYIREKKRKDPDSVANLQVETQYTRIAQLIDSISSFEEGKNKSLIAKVLYLNTEILWDDFNGLVSAIADKDVGIEGTTEATCKACGWENELGLVLNENFFRSSRK